MKIISWDQVRRRPRANSFLAGLLLCASTLSSSAFAQNVSDEDAAFYRDRIQPILLANCFKCHAGGKAKGGFSLATRESLLKGGDQGPAVNLDKPDQSLLLEMLSYKDDEHQMPPTGKLKQEELDLISEWLRKGAPYDGSSEGAPASPTSSHPPKPDPKSHWSFQPLTDPPVPEVSDARWETNPIDSFIKKKLEEKNMQPAPEASREVLIRRATYDLTGLPPSPERVAAFVADPDPSAYSKLIEELLASPHYGEKWGRHWLDVVRYAETNGYERDGAKPHIWKYRDYVIRAMNEDKPYDRFVLEQIAGDELPGAGREGIIATGFYRLGIWDDEPADKEQAKYDELDGIADTTAQTFLGLTMGCARCHDHKIDPIPQRDYYGFLSFFSGMKGMSKDAAEFTASVMPPEEQFEYDLKASMKTKKLRELGGKIARIEKAYKESTKDAASLAAPVAPPAPGALEAEIKEKGESVLGRETFEQYNQLKRDLEEIKKIEIPGEFAACATEAGPQPPETHILIRGNPHVEGDVVPTIFPSIITDEAPQIPEPASDAKSSGRRLALAKWIADSRNRLTSRVMVNRIWQGHFGRGIVRSSNNFGLGGDAPTHPELLDWLAGEFIRRGWSLKAMHRLIMNSETYRMSSRGDAAHLASDPANDYFWRFDMRRLSAEEVRDSILAASGDLNLAVGGKSVFPKMPEAVLATSSTPKTVWGQSPADQQGRRSVYVHLKRSLLTPLLADFDLADTDSSCPVRFTTTLPTQALNMVNSEFIAEQAAHLAQRLQREVAGEEREKIKRALALVTSRTPGETEIERALDFIRESEEKDKLSAEKSLERFCLLALNLNEFVYLD